MQVLSLRSYTEVKLTKTLINVSVIFNATTTALVNPFYLVQNGVGKLLFY